jgi:hypothetical protein
LCRPVFANPLLAQAIHRRGRHNHEVGTIGDREADGRDKDGARIAVDRARQRIVEPARVIGSEELIFRLASGVAVGSLY